MPENIFETKAQMARSYGLDVRNRLLRGIAPDGFLQLGSRRVAIYKRGVRRLNVLAPTPGEAMELSK